VGVYLLRIAVKRKRSEKWRTKSWGLLHNNAPAHRSILVREILAENNIKTLQYPLYCPDLTACDFYLFPRMKLALKGRRFCGVSDIIRKARKI